MAPQQNNRERTKSRISGKINLSKTLAEISNTVRGEIERSENRPNYFDRMAIRKIAMEAEDI